MNENERKSGQTDQDSETLTKSPRKSKSPVKATDTLKSPLKTIDTLSVETPMTDVIENSAAEDSVQRCVDDSTRENTENSGNMDISTLKNTEKSKNVVIPTLKSSEVPKNVDNGTFLGFEKPTLKALVTRKLLEYSKLPLMNSEARLKGDALLKSLLSASTAFTQKMITTTEVTDENLKLRKILYQPDKAKCDEREFDSPLPSANNANDSQNDEDDRRLIIDIPEEMNHKINKKSMPSLESFGDDRENVSKILRPTTLNTAFVSTRPLMRPPTTAQDSEYIPQ